MTATTVSFTAEIDALACDPGAINTLIDLADFSDEERRRGIQATQPQFNSFEAFEKWR